MCRALRSLRRRSVRLGAEAGHPTRSRGSFHPRGGGNSPSLSLSLSFPLALSFTRSPFAALLPHTLPPAPLCSRSLSPSHSRALAVERTYTYVHGVTHTEPRARLSSSIVGLTDSLLSLPALLSLTDTPTSQRQPSSSRVAEISARRVREKTTGFLSRGYLEPRRVEGERRAFSKTQPFLRRCGARTR